MQGCASSRSAVVTNAGISISDVNWHLNKIYLSSEVIAANNSDAYVKFNSTENTVIGNGGCNNFHCSFMVKEQLIKITKIASAKMFCEHFMEQENALLSKLEKVNNYAILDGKLLMYMGKELLLEFSVHQLNKG
jgi:heat shock protein HslJ